MTVFCILRKYPTRTARYVSDMLEFYRPTVPDGLNMVCLVPNGKLSSEGMYINGQEHGLWTEYHSNGQMAARGHYANGKEVGHWEFWSSDGSPEEGEDYPLPD